MKYEACVRDIVRSQAYQQYFDDPQSFKTRLQLTQSTLDNQLWPVTPALCIESCVKVATNHRDWIVHATLVLSIQRTYLGFSYTLVAVGSIQSED